MNTTSDRTLARYPDPLATVFRMRAARVLEIDPDWIMCGNGSDDLLTILVRTFVGAGEWLRMTWPSYILYRTLAGIQGASFEEYRFHSDWSLGNDFCLDREGLRLALLANPNSPSGTLLSPARVRKSPIRFLAHWLLMKPTEIFRRPTVSTSFEAMIGLLSRVR